MKKGRFLLVFLAAFGVLLVVWSRSGAGEWYSRALLGAASVAGPMTHGWILEAAQAPGKRPAWVHGGARVDLQIQFEQLSVGVVPLIALLLATPGVAVGRRLRQIALGLASVFLIDLAIVVLFPLLVYYQNDFTDIAGTFLGLVGFVGAPAIVWFTLSFRELRQWLPRLGEKPTTQAVRRES